MENTHPNVTLRKGETLSGEENDNPPAETTALPNTSQPFGMSQAQLEALTNSIGQMMSFQINNTLSAFESKFMAEIEQVKLGRSRSSSEASQAEDNDEERNEDGDVPSEDSKEEVDEGEDNNDEEDPGSVEGSEPPSSNEQGGAPNTQQRTSGGGEMVTHPQTTETQRRRRRRRRRRTDNHCAKTVPANQTNWSTTFNQVGTV